MIKSRIFKNRYQADKARKNDPFFTGDEVIVKVEGRIRFNQQGSIQTV